MAVCKCVHLLIDIVLLAQQDGLRVGGSLASPGSDTAPFVIVQPLSMGYLPPAKSFECEFRMGLARKYNNSVVKLGIISAHCLLHRSMGYRFV